jgi:hypothetical protein
MFAISATWCRSSRATAPGVGGSLPQRRIKVGTGPSSTSADFRNGRTSATNVTSRENMPGCYKDDIHIAIHPEDVGVEGTPNANEVARVTSWDKRRP